MFFSIKIKPPYATVQACAKSRPLRYGRVSGALCGFYHNHKEKTYLINFIIKGRVLATFRKIKK